MGLAKSSSIVLYSDPSDIRCHLVRCVLAAKNKQVDIIPIEKHELNADLDEQRQVIVDDFLEINPNGHLPSLAYHQLTIIQSASSLFWLQIFQQVQVGTKMDGGTDHPGIQP